MRWRFVRALRVWSRRASVTHAMDSCVGNASLGRWQALGSFPTLGSRTFPSRFATVPKDVPIGQICVLWPPALLRVLWPPALLQQRLWSHLGRLAARRVIATPCLLNFSETSHTHLRVYQSTSKRVQKQGFAPYSPPAGLVTITGTAFHQGFSKSKVNFPSRPSRL